MTGETATPANPVPDRDWVPQFENIGGNCEFGLVRRRVGAESLGLLPALPCRVERLADPAHAKVAISGSLHMVALTMSCR